MQSISPGVVEHTNMPNHFLLAIGRVMVEHAFMDQQLQQAICVMSAIDYSAGVSFLSEIPMTSKRADISKNLARTKEPNLSQLAKMLVLGELVKKHSVDRNIVAHSLPYWRSADGTEIGYFKEENKTRPQIKAQPPYKATVSSLTDLANGMQRVAIWLKMLQPNHMPDGIIVASMKYEDAIAAGKEYGVRHPHWYDDARFPWFDEYRRVFEKECGKPQNRRRKPETQS